MDDLAARFARVVDLDELVAALEAAGINDRAAALRYGVPDVFALGEAVLARLHQPPAHPHGRRGASGRGRSCWCRCWGR
ncbi:hypothetical protein [Phytohabitans rumicis]|uniref:hypothetical protein n=1 Tax=Phytohabitans rumicis TaxID=1076125 RepID=UPI0015675C05|nr:hypothetical protein [Phytohabitans rumicis]